MGLVGLEGLGFWALVGLSGLVRSAGFWCAG